MDRQEPASRRTTVVCGLFAAAMGLFLLLTGLGVIPMPPRSGDGPHWIAAAAGMCFLLAGISIAVGAIHGVSETGELPHDTGWWMRLFYYAIGLVIAGSLASIGSWIAFGTGPRAFGGTGMFMLSREANDMVGRIVFGLGAVLTWLFTIAIAVRGARELFYKKLM
jgi:hypothetical protein